MKVIPLDSEYWTSEAKKADLIKYITNVADEAAELLKGISPNLTIIVKPNLPHFSEQKMTGGSAYDHELVDFTFDPKADFNDSKFRKYVKEAIFHELSHAFYHKLYPREDSQLYWTVFEGLGTEFDTEFAEGEHFVYGETSLEEKKEWLWIIGCRLR